MTEIFHDIRQLYQFRTPVGELSELIEFFSESSSEKTFTFAKENSFTIRMLPSWTPTVWINLGAPYRLMLGNRSYTIQGDEDILLLRNSIATRYNQPDDYIFTIKFFPGALDAFFGIRQSGLTDIYAPATAVLPALLIQKIKCQSSFDRRVQLLEEFFLTTLAKQKSKDHYLKLVRDSIDLYNTSFMSDNTSRLAEKLFVTSKTINRYFHNIVGISPKKYLSLLRARKALASFVADKSSFLPQQFGYYDMSHFYREMVQFTGQRMVARHL